VNDEQVKAAKSLKRALKKCANANLVLFAWSDVGVFVVPYHEARNMPDPGVVGNERFYEWHCEVGVEVGSPELCFDGGAGV